MATRFNYKAIDARGRNVQGHLDAEDERDAARRLKSQGMTLLELAAKANSSAQSRRALREPGKAEVILVLRQLVTLLDAGVPLDDAVGSLAKSLNQPFFVKAFTDMMSALRRGNRFSDALRGTGLQLPSYFYPMLESGELTGQLAEAMGSAVAQMQYELEIANETRTALIYPSILVISGVAAVLLIFVLVVPKFSSLLAKSKASVPWLSQVILGTGMFVNNHVWEVGAAVVLLGMTAASLASNVKLRQRCLDQALNWPLLGAWLQEAELARWSTLLSVLLTHHVDIVRALELSSQSVRATALRDALAHVQKQVKQGLNLSRAVEDHLALDSASCNLIRVGEQSGTLPRMLNAMATLFSDNGRRRMKRFLLVLEPVAILIIGGTIGIIMTGIILAITAVNDINL